MLRLRLPSPILLPLLLLLCALLPRAGQAGPQDCAHRDSVLRQLSETYGETRRGAGLAASTGVMEIYASDRTGTWTIILTLPNGQTCLVASGTHFEPRHDLLASSGQRI